MSLRPEPEQFQTIEQYCEALLQWNIESSGGNVSTDKEIRQRYNQVRELGPVRFEPFCNEPKDIENRESLTNNDNDFNKSKTKYGI